MEKAMINLVERRRVNDIFDYQIQDNKKDIGELIIRIDKEYCFVMHIGIYEQFRRKGYAGQTIDYLLKYEKHVMFSISKHSDSAKAFWPRYIQNKHTTKIKGETYMIHS